MLRPARGRIAFRDTDIAGWESHRVCNLGIGQVAEGRQVFPTLSVAENLEVGAMLPRARAARTANLQRVFGLFPVLAERLAQPAGTLSGGEQQMLAIGRCLMGAPELVMFDEPSLGLAPAVVQQLLRTIRDLNREGLTCVLVEQNVAVSLKLAAHAYVLENGRITLALRRRWADRHRQSADGFDFAFEFVAGHGGGHAGRRSGHDDVAGGELDHFRELDDDLRHVPDHLRQIAVLPHFAVGRECDAAFAGVADLAGGL
jgi:branched-chain amino acid transport system ATP-binding protein